MKKLSVLCGALLLIGASANSQNIDEKDVTVTMDLQPILQLDMSTSDQIEFIFDDVTDYYAGITKYGATQLRISASVDWDLYAIGRSNNGTEWDNQALYGSSDGLTGIPLSALELRQSQPNKAVADDATLIAGAQDYSAAFASNADIAGAGITGSTNSIYYDASGNPPNAFNRYIAGHKNLAAVPGGAPAQKLSAAGGSYITSSGTTSDFYYVMDYRVVPGLPAVFPNARGPLTNYGTAGITDDDKMTSYAHPGVYTMYVQYILLEDQ